MGEIFQPTHLLFILVVALLVLGPKRLPEVGRALGRGIRDFRGALSGDEIRETRDELRNALNTPIETPQGPVEPTQPTADAATATTPAPAAEAASKTADKPAVEDPEAAKQHVG